MNLVRKAVPMAWLLIAVACSAILVVGAVAWFFISIPDASDLNKCITTEMYQVHLCKDDSSYTSLKSIAPAMRNAVIVSEDSAFWDHKGIDWVELRNSFETNIEKGRMARGGSTITQQLAKNVYLNPEKSLLRKIREAVIAIRIERQYEKNLILEKYLNVVEFDKGVYGVKNAAKHYFGVSPGNLSIAQSAWLAFLLPNPKKYSVSFHKSKLTPFAFKQMSEIIVRLARFKRISDDEKRAAIREARAFFGGLSGESRELEDEFENGGAEEESFGEPSDESALESSSDFTNRTGQEAIKKLVIKPADDAVPNENPDETSIETSMTPDDTRPESDDAPAE